MGVVKVGVIKVCKKKSVYRFTHYQERHKVNEFEKCNG